MDMHEGVILPMLADPRPMTKLQKLAAKLKGLDRNSMYSVWLMTDERGNIIDFQISKRKPDPETKNWWAEHFEELP